MKFVFYFTTFPNRRSAESFAKAAVKEGLAACVNVLSPCRSIYRWEGRVCREEEIPVFIKTLSSRAGPLKKRFREWHPYQVPVLTLISSRQANADYLRWMKQQLAQ